MTDPSSRLDDLSPYIYGTTRLGDGKIPFEERVAIARQAIEAGLWIHTSLQYGQALQVLNAAFDLDRGQIPPAIFKIGWESVEQVRDQIKRNLEQVGLPSMAIGQLCPGGKLADEYRTGGACYAGLAKLKTEGLVGRYVLETWPWSSDVASEALRGGFADQIIDGYIFYLNPLQRFVTNELWDLLLAQNKPIIAMRTVAGGSVYRMRDVEGAAPEYLQKRAVQIAPIYEASGCNSWTEFCVRFAFGFPQVKATVGATSNTEFLIEFLNAAKAPQPLPEGVQSEILSLQRQWSDDHDIHAKAWSM